MAAIICPNGKYVAKDKGTKRNKYVSEVMRLTQNSRY